MSTQIETISPALQQYIRQHSLREPALLTTLRHETAQIPEHAMQIDPELAQFLQLLIKLMSAKHILELGTFTGYSSLAMALAMPEDGKLITCDTNASWTEIAQRYWQLAKISHKIELRLAPGLVTLQALLAAGQQNSFDFIFIDANKNDYTAYYQHSVQLLRSGGLIAVDNTLWSGKVADDTNQDAATLAIRELNSVAAQDERVSISLLPIADGLLLAYKN